MKGLVIAVTLGVTASGAAAQVVSPGAGDALFISPMGQPFRGASAEAQVRIWFSSVDANHDDALSLAEMQADADRFFAQLNSNGDREIDPTELRNYEERIAPEIRVGVGMADGVSSGYAQKRRSGLSSQFSKTGSVEAPLERDTVRRGAGAYGLLAAPNPVASADANLNRGISLEEFARAARNRFMLLDRNHDGRIRFDELPSLPARSQRKSR